MAVSFNENEYKGIVERMPFGVMVFALDKDREGGSALVCNYCNPYLLEMYGVKADVLLGKTYEEIRDLFVVPEDIYLAGEHQAMLMDKTVAHAFDFTFHQRRADGTHFWIKGYTNWIIPGELCQSVFYDCTHEVILEGKQHRTQALLETVMDTTTTAIFWKDAQRRFIGANRAFLDVYGFKDDQELIGKNDEEMGWHPDPGPFKDIEEQVIQEGKHSDGAEGVCIIRGKERRIRASKHPLILDDQIIGLVGSFEDITEASRQKEEIEELNRQLLESLEKEKIAGEAKNQFMARMSHDMRTPLTTIMGMTGNGILEAKSPEERERYRAIQEGAQYLLTLINDILDSRRLSEGKIQLTKGITDLREVRKLVDHIIRPSAEEKDIYFSVQAPGQTCMVEADGKRLQQILINLLSNAVKCTHEGGTVVMQITEHNSTEDHVDIRYEIRDNGIGMSREFQSHMFEEFSQETQKGMVEQGSGLGLAIVKRLVDLMEGTIECTSELGKGTTFRVTIPFRRISEEELNSRDTFERTGLVEDHKLYNAVNSGKLLEGKRCLICEDVEINAMIIAQALKAFGVHCDIAANGFIGVEMERKEAYDFILMDIRMPVMDGLEATYNIRSFNQAVPIIALSANNFPEDIQRSLEAGMNAHVAKPVNPQELLGIIVSYLPKES